MGNTSSDRSDDRSDEDLWWSNAGRADSSPVDREAEVCGPSRREFSDDNEFQLELARIRERRRDIIGRKRKEMEDLRSEVEQLKLENQELRKCQPNWDAPDETSDQETEFLRRQNNEMRELLEEKSRLLLESEKVIGKNRELRISIARMQEDLQNLNAEVVSFEKEREDYRAHVIALKDVISVSKHMLQIRESQLKELKQKIDNIESSLSDHEAQVMSQDLRREYEKQLANIRSLRQLYEERQRMERREKEDLKSKMGDMKNEMEEEQKKNSELQDRISELETDNSTKYDAIKTLESNLGLSKAESRQYKSELSVINQLFSEILLGFNSSQDIDLDRLQKHLEDHHDLLQDIVVNEISSEVSYALPKVLLDLLNQVNVENKAAEEKPVQVPGSDDLEIENVQEPQESTSSIHQQMNSAEEIVANLPKVWRVLIELLSHQTAPTNTLSTAEDQEHPCYKTVDTPKGPSPVLSVSRTFIRLKDLILEKKSLEKETNHLKQLNGHLENRLQDQEKRLELVHSELSKTWVVVGTLQKQHQMLHTQEKILRYELAQKRKLLNELKEELEDSREKWAQAREKNSDTEQQWRLLRTEFSARKTAVLSEEYNNSGESGYSDDREGLSSDEEHGYETDVSEGVQKAAGSENCEVMELEVLRGVEEDGASLLQIDGREGAQKDTGTKNCEVLQLEVLRVVEGGADLLDIDVSEGAQKAAGSENCEVSELEVLRGVVEDGANLLQIGGSEGAQKVAGSENCKISELEKLPEILEDRANMLQIDGSEMLAGSSSENNGIVTDTGDLFLDDDVDNDSQKITVESQNEPSTSHIPPDSDRLLLNDLEEHSEISKDTVDVTDNLQKPPDSTESRENLAECIQRVTDEGNIEVVKLQLNDFEDESEISQITEDVTDSPQKPSDSIESRGTLAGCIQQIIDKDNTEVDRLQINDPEIFKNTEDVTGASQKHLDCTKSRKNITECTQKITSNSDRIAGSLSDIEHSRSSKEQSGKVLDSNHSVQGVPTTSGLHTSEESLPSCSGGQKLTLEEVLARRDERLKRLEGQASQLVSKVANTAIRSDAISSRLDDLHEVYGQNVENDESDESVQNENSRGTE